MRGRVDLVVKECRARLEAALEGAEPVWPAEADVLLVLLEGQRDRAAAAARRAATARQLEQSERADVRRAVIDYLSMPVAFRRAARKLRIPSAIDRLPDRLRPAALAELDRLQRGQRSVVSRVTAA